MRVAHNRLSIASGTKFGKLAIIQEIEPDGGRRTFLCRCDCGNLKAVRLVYLTTYKTRSCGCYSRETSKKVNTKHGRFGESIYRVWGSMIQRCCNPRNEHYNHYGARGITICPQWYEFEQFYGWALGAGYNKGLTIERKNNNEGYNPSNCIWTSKLRQANNRRSNRRIEYKGESHTLADWGRITRIKDTILWKRIFQRKWSIERSLTTPVRDVM